MTSETITPKKWIGKKKDGEVFRLQLFMAEKGLKPEDIQRDTSVTVRTITNSIYEKKPLGSKLLRELHVKYGVSIDWLVSGVGTMILDSGKNVGENTSPVYDTGDLINRTERDQRIMAFISDWLTYADDDEKAWLEMELKFNLEAYRRFIDDNHD